LYDGAQVANFWRYFASCIFSEPRAARFRPASQIRTKATPYVEVLVDSQSPTAEIRPGKKKKKEEEEETAGQKYKLNVRICHWRRHVAGRVGNHPPWKKMRVGHAYPGNANRGPKTFRQYINFVN